MRSHRRREPIGHVLIAGHTDDLDDIRAALAMLAADTYGQVLVVAPIGTQLDLTAPARITVHRIDDAAGSLADAVAGWAAEWIPDELDSHRKVTVWIGAHASSHVDPVHHGWPVEQL